jgi:hypothetical protein
MLRNELGNKKQTNDLELGTSGWVKVVTRDVKSICEFHREYFWIREAYRPLRRHIVSDVMPCIPLIPKECVCVCVCVWERERERVRSMHVPIQYEISDRFYEQKLPINNSKNQPASEATPLVAAHSPVSVSDQSTWDFRGQVLLASIPVFSPISTIPQMLQPIHISPMLCNISHWQRR